MSMPGVSGTGHNEQEVLQQSKGGSSEMLCDADPGNQGRSLMLYRFARGVDAGAVRWWWWRLQKRSIAVEGAQVVARGGGAWWWWMQRCDGGERGRRGLTAMMR